MPLSQSPVPHGGEIFAVAQSHGWDWHDVLDFSASINPLGPSPAVNKAIVASLDRIAHYPEREPSRLSHDLARLWSVKSHQILTGNGATELLFFFARVFESEDAALAVPVFSEFHRAFPQAKQVCLHDMSTWPEDRLLILTRPSNPLGTTIPFEILQPWLLRTTNPVLIDESFLDFSVERSAAELIGERPGLTILRSLTKFYAFPGLRVGALVSDGATVSRWRSQREPWQVNVLAEAAALAAIADTDHAARSLDCIRAERAWLLTQLKRLTGVRPQESDANFLFVRTAFPARQLADFLLSRKLLLRVCTGWPGVTGEAVRIAVRTRAENERLIKDWSKFSCAC